MILRFLLAMLLLMFSFPVVAGSSTAEVIDSFYRKYFNHLADSTEGVPELRYSREFLREMAENRASCEEYADGICGFGVDGDIFLDSQEVQDQITYASAGVSVVEGPENTVVVTLNVYPSLPEHRRYYQKRISYKMKLEDGEWSVDDIFYSDGVSSRKRMKDENAQYQQNPDPGSRHQKRSNKRH